MTRKQRRARERWIKNAIGMFACGVGGAFLIAVVMANAILRLSGV